MPKVKVWLGFVLATLLTVSNLPIVGGDINACSIEEVQQLNFDTNPNQPYARSKVLVYFCTSGPYVERGPIKVTVDTAWISESTYQNASSYYFSFENAFPYANGRCLPGETPNQPPAVKLSFAYPSFYDTVGKYRPPSYNGTGYLCFLHPANYVPIFIVNVKNGSQKVLHQLAYEKYQLTINAAENQDWFSATISWLASNPIVVLIVLFFGGIVGFFEFVWKRIRRPRRVRARHH